MGQKISIIVPVHNEAASLGELYSRIRDVFSTRDEEFELVLVNDGSSDNTLDVARKLSGDNPGIRTINLARNKGKSIALSVGFNAADGDIAVTMDGDLQDLPEMIPTLLDTADKGFDLVCGYRVFRKDSWIKRFLSWVFNSFVRILFSRQAKDINCGLKAYRKTVYKNVTLKRGDHRLIALIVEKMKFRVAYVPVQHAPRQHGGSRYQLFRMSAISDFFAFALSGKKKSHSTTDYRNLAVVLTVLTAFAVGGWCCLAAWMGAFSLLALLAGALAIAVSALSLYIAAQSFSKACNPEYNPAHIGEHVAAGDYVSEHIADR